jgi:hypothetical protein
MALGLLTTRRDRTLKTLSLDAVIVEGYESSVTATDNPVEFGVEMTDHAIINPRVYRMEAAVTNTPLGSQAVTQLQNSASSLFTEASNDSRTRAEEAFYLLEEMRIARELITVKTGLADYPNMLLLSIKVNQDKTTSQVLFFEAVIREVFIPVSETSVITKDQVIGDTQAQATSPTPRGKQQAKPVTETTASSYLKKIFKAVTGKSTGAND